MQCRGFFKLDLERQVATSSSHRNLHKLNKILIISRFELEHFLDRFKFNSDNVFSSLSRSIKLVDFYITRIMYLLNKSYFIK